MDVGSIGSVASMSTEMHMLGLQTETATRVLDMANEAAEQDGAALVKMMNEQTGIGANFDASA